MRSRVRNVEDMPSRLRSRNSTRLNWRADGDDQTRALLGGDQHRDVLAGPGGGHEFVLQPELLAGGGGPGRGRRGRSARRARRRSAGRPPPAESMSPTIMSRREALLEQRVRAAVDGDDHGPQVADERAAAREDRAGWPTPRTTTSVERSRKSVWKRGSSIRPASSSRSSRMCSIVLCAKRSSASPISAATRLGLARRRARGRARSPRASTSPRRRTSPSRSEIAARDGSPSERISEERVVRAGRRAGSPLPRAAAVRGSGRCRWRRGCS